MQERAFKSLVDNAGFAVEVCRLVTRDGVPVDALVEYANPVAIEGLRRYYPERASEFIGRSLPELARSIEPSWLEQCARVALGKQGARWIWENRETRQWLTVYAIPIDEEDLFALAYVNVTAEHDERGQTFSALNSSAVILHCARFLQSDLSIEDAMQGAFAEMAVMFHPDRIYLGRVDRAAIGLVATWNAPGVDSRLPTFQNMDPYMISWWEQHLDDNGTMVIDDPETQLAGVEDSVGKRIMESLSINRMMVTMIRQHDRVVGYLGADNYRLSEFFTLTDACELLETVAFFAGARMHNEHLIGRLKELGRIDELTGLSNRNAFNDDITQLARRSEPVGLIFCDVNGLKETNDTYGHEAGDALLRRCARALPASFLGMTAYRIGGDEFMVVAAGFSRERFEEERVTGVARLQADQELSVSLGWSWAATGDGIASARKAADTMMYDQKAAYYRVHDRRRR